MEPNIQDQDTPVVYKDGVCWYGTPAQEHPICGYPGATRFSLRKTKINSTDGGIAPIIVVWLCEKHRKAIERKGFVCTKV